MYLRLRLFRNLVEKNVLFRIKKWLGLRSNWNYFIGMNILHKFFRKTPLDVSYYVSIENEM